MSNTDWSQYLPYALVGAIIFAFMHMAEKMAGKWDAGAPGGPMYDPTMASIGTQVILLVSVTGLVLMLQGKDWGNLLALLVGLWAVLMGGSHFVNTADMAPVRLAVVVLEVVFAATVVVLSANAMWTTMPWQRRCSTEA